MIDLQADPLRSSSKWPPITRDQIVLGITLWLLTVTVLMRVTTGTSISSQLLVGTVICLSRSSDAKVTVENEQERVTAEITAFERFATQLKQLEIIPKTTMNHSRTIFELNSVPSMRQLSTQTIT